MTDAAPNDLRVSPGESDDDRESFLHARQLIDKMDAVALEQVLASDPTLATRRDPEHGYLIEGTQSYANFAGENEEHWVSVRCAELLVEAGSPVPLRVLNRAINTACIRDYLKPIAIERRLTTAVQCGTVDDVRKHLDAGTNVDEPISLSRAEGVTPLMLAVTADVPEIVEFLLEQGAGIRRTDSNGRGVLHRIQPWAKNGERLARILIAAGADVNATSKDGVTPLASARANGQDAAAKILEQHGARETDA